MTDILLVEDDNGIASGLALTLKKENYSYKIADSINKAEAFLYSESFGRVLLDVTLPDGNGFDFYKNELKPAAVPAIFMTARDEESDIVKGLDMGAEDYVTKPFSTRELMARIKRVFMRNRKVTAVTSGGVTFDFQKMQVTRDGNPINLSSLELKILQLLFANHDKVVKRSSVIDCIYDATGNDVYDHTVTVYLKRIREKLGTDIITTVKGIGYRIDTEMADE